MTIRFSDFCERGGAPWTLSYIWGTLRAVRVWPLFLIVAGCFDRAADAPPPAGCTSCHGSTNSAPPNALGNALDTIGVGAHQQHLQGVVLGNPVACSECHLEPTTVDAPGHIDDSWPADMTWGAISRTGGADPKWNREAATCTNTYCHGDAEPVWTTVDGTASQCGACHGTPPAPPHPASAACQDCHGPVAGPQLTLADPSKHLDGTVDLGGNTPGTCGGSCHGSDANEAPPTDLNGGTDTTLTGVGAHQAHLSGGGFSAPVLCTECHVEITAVGDPGHTDTPAPAEVVFGALAGPNAAWDGTSCANTHCHGMGGTHEVPVWTTVDGSQAACGSCHLMPPGGTHPQVRACNNCHGTTAGPNDTIVDRALHINGTTNF